MLVSAFSLDPGSAHLSIQSKAIRTVAMAFSALLATFPNPWQYLELAQIFGCRP
jgi:hypothetical protein